VAARRRKKGAFTPRVPDVSSILTRVRKLVSILYLGLFVFNLFVCEQNLEDSDWTNSLYTSPVSGLDSSSFFRDDEANLSSALLKEDDPGEAVAASLFPEFLASFLKHSSSAVFELLEDYQNICQEKVNVLQSVVLRAGQNSKTAGVRWLLQQENCTWRLIASLYRYPSNSLSAESEKVVVEQLFQRDAVVRQSQVTRKKRNILHNFYFTT
uniref:Uncharacterized protein n=1 Tax=Xiphophorus maculatus TaxID=8083 RepID=A0A3B5PSA4_XIPMA